MDLECIILSEISKRQILYDLIYMWNLKIKQTNAYTKNKDSDIQNKRMDTKGEEVRLGDWDQHIYTIGTMYKTGN